MPRVGVIGLGYVGQSTAVCLARKMSVIGLDTDRSKTRSLERGKPTISEKGVPALLRRGLSRGRLSFSSDYRDLDNAKFIFLTVGTPSLDSGKIDLSQVEAAARAVGREIGRGSGQPVIVIKSTVTPGTARQVVRRILEDESDKKMGKGFGLCSNPEFLREGAAVEDTLHPDRLVIGSDDAGSVRALRNFYKEFYGSALPRVVTTDHDSAELIKCASNAFLATKVSFINVVARMAEKLPGSDVGKVAEGLGLDPRIGERFLEAGPGYGGSCLPKDLKALIAHVNEQGVDSSLLRAVEQINATQPGHVLSIAERSLGSVADQTVAVLGLSFKPGTDDVRESRAIRLIEILLRKGALPRVYDPKAMANARKAIGSSVTYCTSAMNCIAGADLAVVMNAEPEFERLKPDDFLRLMRRAAVLDTRRIYNREDFDGRLPLLSVGVGVRGR